MICRWPMANWLSLAYARRLHPLLVGVGFFGGACADVSIGKGISDSEPNDVQPTPVIRNGRLTGVSHEQPFLKSSSLVLGPANDHSEEEAFRQR